MAESVPEGVCARPGCGHNRDQVKYFFLPLSPQDFGHDLDGCHVVTKTPEGWMRCPCPSFRTQAQQEAWEDLVLHHSNYCNATGAGHDSIAALCLGSIYADAERLLELYP